MTTNEHTPTQDLEASLAEEQVKEAFEYTRQDGTIERAQTAKEVFDKCPVLGKIALESPDTANLMLELAAIGKAKMREQAPEPELKEEPAKREAHVVEPAANKPEVAITSQPQEVKRATTPQMTEHETIRTLLDQAAMVTQEADTKEAPAIAKTTLMPEVANTDPSNMPLATDARTPHEELVTDSVKRSTHVSEPLAIERVVTAPIIETSQQTETVFKGDVEPPEITHSLMQEGEVIVSENEVRELFEELVALDESARTEEMPDEMDAPVGLQPTAQNEVPPQLFETFLLETIEAKTEETVPPSLATLEIAVAEEAPLEEVLVQLAELLQQPDAKSYLMPIKKLITETRPYLMLPGGEQQRTIELTPAITRQLLVLLSALGYEHPGDVLRKCVSVYDMRFLLDILYYLTQLNLEENRQEFISPPAMLTSIPDSSELERLGKLLFKLVSRLAFEPMRA